MAKLTTETYFSSSLKTVFLVGIATNKYKLTKIFFFILKINFTLATFSGLQFKNNN